MTATVQREVLRKVRNLRQLVADLRQGKSFQVTRLTTLKSLCDEPTVANRFVTYLARKTLERVKQGHRRSGRLPVEQARAHLQMMTEAVAAIVDWPADPPQERQRALSELLHRMQAEQNEQRPIPFGALRLIRDWELLLLETAVRCVLRPHEAGHWAYKMARDYAEQYDARHPGGLVPASAPLVQDIVDFWIDEHGLDRETLATAIEDKETMDKQPAARKATNGSVSKQQQLRFTERQGQFLAFIHLYRKLHRQGPAELDLVKFFRVTPPSVHGMIGKLEELGLVTRESGVARSVRVVVPEEKLPKLEDVAGPPW